MQRDDLDDWRKSEVKKLKQYQQQEMFGEPEARPLKANILSLLWTYLIKSDGTKRQDAAVTVIRTEKDPSP